MSNRKIKNWHEFQHYKRRDPPWIKLHKRLLHDRQFDLLSGDDTKALIRLWLVASEHAGNLLADDDLAFILRMNADEIPALLERLAHWLEPHASNVLAPCKQVAPLAEERRGETEQSRKTPQESFSTPAEERKTEPASLAPLANGSLARPTHAGMSPDVGNDYRSPPRSSEKPPALQNFHELIEQYGKPKHSVFSNPPPAKRTAGEE